jgi:hypothetical protein
MAAFWLGSIPLLVGLVAGTRLLNGRAGRLLPFAVSILLVVAGAYTASGRGFASLVGGLQVSSVLLDRLNAGVQADSIDAETMQAGMKQLVATPLPCCQEKLSTGDVSNPSPPAALSEAVRSELHSGQEVSGVDDQSLEEGASP